MIHYIAGPAHTKASWENRVTQSSAQAAGGVASRAGRSWLGMDAEFNLSYIYGCLLLLERRVGTSPFYYQYIFFDFVPEQYSYTSFSCT